MLEIQEIIKSLKSSKDTGQKFDNGSYLQNQCNLENSILGNYIGYDCPICMNRGYTAVVSGDYIVHTECKCMNIRRNMLRINKSGLGSLIHNYTFETYQVKEDWQRHVKYKAEEYLKCSNGEWFFIGGQVGCGKTHICTAITCKLMKAGKLSKYMLWRDEAVKIKAVVNDDYEYSKIINELKSVPVLYIDDFLKADKDKGPTAADVNIAFEILNYRYINKSLITIISSEKTVNDILYIDEAIGSRIFEKSRSFNLTMKKDIKRNYRLRA